MLMELELMAIIIFVSLARTTVLKLAKVALKIS